MVDTTPSKAPPYAPKTVRTANTPDTDARTMLSSVRLDRSGPPLTTFAEQTPRTHAQVGGTGSGAPEAKSRALKQPILDHARLHRTTLDPSPPPTPNLGLATVLLCPLLLAGLLVTGGNCARRRSGALCGTGLCIARVLPLGFPVAPTTSGHQSGAARGSGADITSTC